MCNSLILPDIILASAITASHTSLSWVEGVKRNPT